MPDFSLDGRAIEYRVVPGDASKPWVVLLHEGLGSVSLWRDFPEALARRLGMRVLVYSRFGYGRSAGLSGPRTIDFMHREARDALPRVLAHFGIERPVLIGHSDGASIALIRAADAPSDTHALVAMAPHVMVETVSHESIARIRQAYGPTSELRARLARHHDHVDDAFLGWADVWLLPEFRDWSLAGETSALRVPTLLIQGVDDEYGTLAQLDSIERLATAAEVRRLVLDRCGHSPHRDQRDAVLEAIGAFVSARTG